MMSTVKDRQRRNDVSKDWDSIFQAHSIIKNVLKTIELKLRGIRQILSEGVCFSKKNVLKIKFVICSCSLKYVENFIALVNFNQLNWIFRNK